MGYDLDLFFVIGLTVLVLAIPSILSAWSDGRAPRAGSILLLIGGGLMLIALTQKPGGYRVEEVPHLFFQVIGRYF